ncbi:MAG: hypothetical protein U0M12_09165 [Acutalibacteraceae bacterium]|nr:hypothetical protein [Acutalibacteraceae bacterium]
MGYVYTIAFVIIGIYLIYYAIKEYRFLLLPGIYFIFLGGWWLTDELLTNVNLLGGIYGWVIRGISAVVLVITGLIYYFKYRKNKS